LIAALSRLGFAVFVKNKAPFQCANISNINETSSKESIPRCVEYISPSGYKLTDASSMPGRFFEA